VKINFRKALVSREFFLFALIIILAVFMYFKTDTFFTLANIKSMTLIISVNSIIAAAMTVLFISGGFDLSSGSVMAFLGVMIGIFISSGINFIIVIIIVLALGTAIGSSIGFVVTKGGVNPFIATLGAMFMFQSLAFVIGLASPKMVAVGIPTFSFFDSPITKIAGGALFGIENSFYYMLAILIIFSVLIVKNRFFRQSYYIGGNEDASRLLGIKVDRIKIFNYALVSFMVAFATILKASRFEQTSASWGESLGLEVVAAVIIGGASLKGGEGSIIGSFLGIVLLTLIFNIIVLLGKNPLYYEFSVGIILLATAVLNDYVKKVYKNRRIIKSI